MQTLVITLPKFSISKAYAYNVLKYNLLLSKRRVSLTINYEEHLELANLYTICTFSGKFGQNHATRFVVENEIFSVKIATFIAKMDSRTLHYPWETQIM